MKNSVVILSIILTSAFASAGSPLLISASCKSKDGSVLNLRKNQDSSYKLSFSAVTKVFGEGYYRLETVDVAEKLSCSLVSSAIACESTEEVQVDIPKAGIRNKVENRKHILKIGSRWDPLISIQGAESSPNMNLGLQAAFSVELPLGEVLVKAPVQGTNTKTNEVEQFEVDKSNIILSVQGNEASCTARVE